MSGPVSQPKPGRMETAESLRLEDAHAGNGASYVDADGSMHVRDLIIRPSDLCSPEFRAFYVRSVADSSWTDWPIPARTASRSEWDKFDTWLDTCCNQDLLKQVLERYPVDVLSSSIAGVAAATVTPKGGIRASNEGRVLINLHGGGFVFNRGLLAGQLEAVPVAAIGSMRVITLDYRQAPFHRYPAASEDVEAVYRELLKQYAPESIGIYGCSAGGALASQAVARFHSRGLPRPGAVGIFSIAPPPPFSRELPWGVGWGDSAIWFSSPPKNTPSAIEKKRGNMSNWYMEDADINDPNAYPGSFDGVLATFPPTLFLTGTRDFAASAAIASHSRLLKLGVDAALYIMEGAPHGAHVIAVGTPEAHDANAHIARWFDQHLTR